MQRVALHRFMREATIRGLHLKLWWSPDTKLAAQKSKRFTKRKLMYFKTLLILIRQWDKPTLTNNDATLQQRFRKISPLRAFTRNRPELCILSGVTWKCSMRSAFYWFAEFCHSRGLSHFAASFIVTRAEASIAKSCDVINTKSYK